MLDFLLAGDETTRRVPMGFAMASFGRRRETWFTRVAWLLEQFAAVPPGDDWGAEPLARAVSV